MNEELNESRAEETAGTENTALTVPATGQARGTQQEHGQVRAKRRRRDPREKLDEKKRATIVALLQMGCSRRMAARHVGCTGVTITRTAERDPQFHEQVAAAESRADEEALLLVRRAARNEKYWRAAAWLLERRNPREFGQRNPVTYTSDQMLQIFGHLITVLYPSIPDDIVDKVVAEGHRIAAEIDAQMEEPRRRRDLPRIVVEPGKKPGIPRIEAPDETTDAEFAERLRQLDEEEREAERKKEERKGEE